MNARITLAALAIGLSAGIALADDDVIKTTTEESKTTIEGEVVQMEPGKTIVLRKSGGETVTYQLTPNITLPAEVKVGRTVVLYTDQPASQVVTKVTTSSVGPLTKRVEETTDELGNVQSKTTYTVKGFEPGRQVTLVSPSGQVVTYSLNATSEIPADLTIGKSVSVVTDDSQASPVARRIIYSKKTTTTEEEVDD